MVEPAINQGLSEIRGGFTVVGGLTRRCVLFAYRDFRQVAHIQASQVDGGVGWAEVARPDVQGCGEGVVADVRCIVTGAAGSLERRNAASDQASGSYIVVDAGNSGDGNLQSVEELLAAGDGASGGDGAPGTGMLIVLAVLDVRPFVVEVEDVGGKLGVAGIH